MSGTTRRDFLRLAGTAAAFSVAGLSCAPKSMHPGELGRQTAAEEGLVGAVCGIYFFESQAALAAFRDSELAATIRTAYDTVEFRPEVYTLLYPLRPERGPFPG